MTISNDVLDTILKEYKNPDDFFGKGGVFKDLTKRLIERAMQGEMTNHLGYDTHSVQGNNSGNSRNGESKKQLKGDFGQVEIKVPRDRNGSFSPQIVAKGETHFSGFDDKIMSLYSRGLSTREIQNYIKEIYGVDISPTLVSSVTDAVLEDVNEWQHRPLDSVYPIVYFDALMGKVRDNGQVINKAIYLALGVNMDGQKEVLGMWISASEGAKFWLKILTEIKNRGVKDIFIACVDGLKGFPEAIESTYSQTKVQLCIVHMVRHSFKFVSWKDRKQVACDLRTIYKSVNSDDAELNLVKFAEKWDSKYPAISQSWQRNWAGIIPFFDYPEDIRKVIYTTNAIESLNRSLRKISKTRAVFPNDTALIKLFYLALKNISKKWTMPLRDWGSALNRFTIELGDRVPIR